MPLFRRKPVKKLGRVSRLSLPAVLSSMKWPNAPLLHTLYAHVCVLAIKLVFLQPLRLILNHFQIRIKQISYSVEVKTVLPFIIVARMYLTTNPPQKVAVTIFRAFSFFRLMDCMCCSVRRQRFPTLHIAHMGSYSLICFMALMTVKHYMHAI